MINLLDAAPPLAGTGQPLGSDGHPSAHGRGWRRELDEALVAGWFHGPLQQHPSAPWVHGYQPAAPALIQMGEGTARSSPGASEARRASAWCGAADGRNSARLPVTAAAPCVHEGTRPSGMPSPPERAVSRYPVSLPPPALNAAPDMRALPLDPVAPGDAVEPAQHELVREPPTGAMRVHVESGPDGMFVWLGLDGDSATVAARAAAILVELRRLAGPAQRLANVVCNGTTIYTDAAHPRPLATPSSRETSWP